jgi:hypothetical protein
MEYIPNALWLYIEKVKAAGKSVWKGKYKINIVVYSDADGMKKDESSIDIKNNTNFYRILRESLDTVLDNSHGKLRKILETKGVEEKQKQKIIEMLQEYRNEDLGLFYVGLEMPE